MTLVHKLYKVLCFIAIAFFVAFFYCATSSYQLGSDDWTYRFVFTQNRLVESISDVITSQVIHLHRWGGRFVVHFLVQSFLMIDKIWFDIANTLCYAGCCAAVSRLISKSDFLRNWLLVLLSFWIIMPGPAETMFWLTGSFNYLWASCLTAIFLTLLFSENKKYQIAAVVVGLIAGNGHESISLGVSWILVVYAVVTRKKSLIYYAAVAAYVIGMLTNVLAPGNFVRLAPQVSVEQAGIIPYVLKYVKHLLKVGYRLTFNWSELGAPCCTLLWCAAVYVCTNLRKKMSRQGVLAAVVLSGAVVSLSLNVLSGVSYARSVYGFCFLSYLGFLLVFMQARRECWKNMTLGVLLLANLMIIPQAYNDISIQKKSMEKVYRECSEGKKLISVVPECDMSLSSRYACSPVSVLMNSPSNRSLARLLGLESISILKAADAAAIERHYSEIKTASVHEVIHVDHYLGLVRLLDNPKSVAASIKRISHIKPGDSYLAKIQDWIARQQGFGGNSHTVIRIDDGYYLFWERGFSNGTVQVTYADGTSTVINVD